MEMLVRRTVSTWRPCGIVWKIWKIEVTEIMLGLEEGIEGGNIKACTEKLLAEAFSIDIDNEFESEQAHCSPGSHPNEDQPGER